LTSMISMRYLAGDGATGDVSPVWTSVLGENFEEGLV